MKTSTTKLWLVVAVMLACSIVYTSTSKASEEIVSGETKHSTISFGGETHSYYFWAEANQGVVISMGDMSSAPGIIDQFKGLEPRVQLYDPNGVRVAESGSDGQCYSRAIIENYQTKMTGFYTVVASDADGYWPYSPYYKEYTPDTGDFALSLVVAPSDTNSLCECIVSGETKSKTLQYGGEIHGYCFWAEAGHGVIIEMADLSSASGIINAFKGLEPWIELYDPNGVRVANVGSNGQYYSRARIENCQLKITGVYTIVAGDADGYWPYSPYYKEYTPDTGEYGLSLVVTGGTTTSIQDPNGGDMTIGHTQMGNISPIGDTDAYSFYGKVNQGVSIVMSDFSSTSGIIDAFKGLEPRVQLYDPNGVLVAESGSDGKSYSSAKIEDYQLEMPGIYTIVVSEADGYWPYSPYYKEYTPDTGEYGISVNVMPQTDPCGLYPYGPDPADGELVNISEAKTLSWWSVKGATQYDVLFYVGPCMTPSIWRTIFISTTGPDALQNVVRMHVSMPELDPNEVYYWQVVAHTPTEDIKGSVWWFATESSKLQYTLNLSAIGHGAITEPNVEFINYPNPQVMEVTAAADPNFEFVRWEGTAVDANKVAVIYENSTGSKVSVTVDGVYTLKAVFEDVICNYDIDSNPGWSMNVQWEFGKPAGLGGRKFGYPDPTKGHTGENVIGVNLNGDYDTTVGGPNSVIAGPFDLRGYRDIKLCYWRWLNSDWGEYVESLLEISFDGQTWELLYQNPAADDVTDNQWNSIEYDFADPSFDNQPTVYLKWSYEVIKDRANPYSGWNIDDIKWIGHR
jgi:hypothetical protein